MAIGGLLSVIVEVINQLDVHTNESENYTPVSANVLPLTEN